MRRTGENILASSPNIKSLKQPSQDQHTGLWQIGTRSHPKPQVALPS